MSNPRPASFDHDLISALRTALTGSLELPGSTGYDAAAPWNTSAIFEPAAVISVADANDVAASIHFAVAHGFRLAVQATGHGAVSRGPDTLVIHTGRLDHVDVDTVGRTATFGAGVVAEDLIAAAADRGLAAVLGSAGTVSAAGYLSGGGVGPLVSSLGLSSDYVERFEVVTGDGAIHRVSAAENPDLFWAFRGAKSTLGIVTEVTLRLEPLEEIYGGALWFDGENSSAVLHAWAAWAQVLPSEITTSVVMARMPPEGPPPPIAGRFVVAVRVGSLLSPEQTEPLLRGIRDVAEPILGSIDVLEYRNVGRIHSEPRQPEPVIQDQALLTGFPSAAADRLLEAFSSSPGHNIALAEVRRFGGALAREPEHASAFSFRDAAYGLTAIGFDPVPGSTRVVGATEALLAEFHEWASGHALVNFARTRDSAPASRTYDPATVERLARLTEQYNPYRFFAN